MAKILTILADGCEEIETVTPIDILRRAKQEVTIAGLDKKEIKGSNGILFLTETTLDLVKELDFDMLLIPGGHQGALNLSQSPLVKNLLQKQHAQQKWIAAICAAPALVLNSFGLLSGKKATAYPGYEVQFNEDVTFVEKKIVHDGHIITSRGAGTSFEYGLYLAALLTNEVEATEVSQKTLFYNYYQSNL